MRLPHSAKTEASEKRFSLPNLDSLHRHGFKRFIILNAHGGNIAVSGVIGEKAITLWPDSEVLVTTWFRLAADAIREFVEGKGLSVGHACEFETSLMLHLHPDLVDMSKAVDDGIVPHAEQLRGDLLDVPFNDVSERNMERETHGWHIVEMLLEVKARAACEGSGVIFSAGLSGEIPGRWQVAIIRDFGVVGS